MRTLSLLTLAFAFMVGVDMFRTAAAQGTACEWNGGGAESSLPCGCVTGLTGSIDCGACQTGPCEACWCCWQRPRC